MAIDSVTPSNVLSFPNPPDGEQPIDDRFYNAFEGLNAAIETLQCAYLALQTSNALDGCEAGSGARNVLGRATRNLRLFHNALDQWYVTSNHAPKPEVGHV